MNKTELVAAIAEKTELSKKISSEALDAIVSSISDALSNDESVQLIGFGTFCVRNRAERQGKNPLTGEPITIAACKVPSFKSGKSLKEAVNK